MPIYEYYCPDCHGVFEQLRAVRDAQDSAPCPECDTDANRILSTDLQIFTLRDGYPRRLPDRGTFWHLGKEVASPVTGAVQSGDHQDLVHDKYGPPKVPTTEEREAFAEKIEKRLEHEAESIASGRPPIRDVYQERQAAEFTQRLEKTRDRARLARKRAPNKRVTPRTRSGEHRPTRD